MCSLSLWAFKQFQMRRENGCESDLFRWIQEGKILITVFTVSTGRVVLSLCFCSVSVLFSSIWIQSGREVAIPLHYFSTKKSPNPRSNKQQIMFNFANPSIVLGTLLRRQTESYFLFSPSVQFLFCSVLFGSNQVGKRQSLFIIS